MGAAESPAKRHCGTCAKLYVPSNRFSVNTKTTSKRSFRPSLRSDLGAKDGIRDHVNVFMPPRNQHRPVTRLGGLSQRRLFSFAERQVDIDTDQLSQGPDRLLRPAASGVTRDRDRPRQRRQK